MSREQFKMPDGDVAAEFERVCQLFQMALGKPSDRVLFDSLMGEANARGMNWVEGLQYVVERRDEVVEPQGKGRRKGPGSVSNSASSAAPMFGGRRGDGWLKAG